jgi:putative ABC transport system permease protein
VGARNSDILTLFLVESGMLGMAGGGIGVILGVTLSKLVEYAVVNFGGFEILQASFPWYLIVGALAFSMIVGMLSGIIPAIRASRMDPVEALEG